MAKDLKVNPSELRITKVKTSDILLRLQTTFDVVSSGKEYNKDQVKNMTNIANSMVKVLRFEFDVYKFFANQNISEDNMKEPKELERAELDGAE